MRTGATISDVASAAGVSRATVSRVMNGSTVDAELTRRVRAAAAELHYRPSVTARSLSLGRTLAVGIVVPDLANPMFQAVLRAVADGAHRHGYSVVVAETAGPDRDEADIVRSTRARCDALVIVAPRMSQEVLAEVLDEVDPVVLVNRTVPGSATPSVNVDYSPAMYGVVEHLVGLGHRAIAYLSGPESSPSNTARLDGLGRARLAFGDVRFFTLACGATVAEGYALAHAALATQATAVVAYNDQVAFGLLGHLHELGVDVPGTLSVVGFDDIELARYATPSLTTVHVPYDEIGARAWARLHARIAGEAEPAPDAGVDVRGAAEVLPAALLTRASSATAPAAG
ncbi:LacI family DNA-binding transcriptional regulator [Cellulomonas sp. GbtcB1]|uniref:LacI family DNA-binding transcriptional regulator n=1 Tax=Cellulomonas sp. GbtcB1 TaxID=2824746 RepID=UPI001C30BA99|nr:LacI family DNA-binding transcriptional regulator [Cellulomonas sp. GbtcB1]